MGMTVDGKPGAVAHRMLRDPLLASRRISTIAFDIGFSDLSYFNRTFRRAFGVTPSHPRANITNSGTDS